MRREEDFVVPAQQAGNAPAGDARDLLSRLYREIGVAAVAAALAVPSRPREQRRPAVTDIPAVLRGEDKAA